MILLGGEALRASSLSSLAVEFRSIPGGLLRGVVA